MANNTILNVGVGGDTLVDVDLATGPTYPVNTGKLPMTGLYFGPDVTTLPTPVTDVHPFPVRVGTLRKAGVLHRNAITVVDKLAVPAAPTLADVTGDGGTLAISTSYAATVSAANRWGITTNPTSVALTTGAGSGATHSINLTIAQVIGPLGDVAEFYDLFLFAGAAASNPLYVGRITEAQRASGGCRINTMGTVTTGGSAAAGSVNVGVVGTGGANNLTPFTANNAFCPALITPLVCTGYSKVNIVTKVTVTDMRSVPSFSMTYFGKNQASSSDWHLLLTSTPVLLNTVSSAMENTISVVIDGSTNLVITLSAIAGQGTAVTIWLELC